MAWYNPRDWFVEKANPAQANIQINEGYEAPSTFKGSYLTAFDSYEAVNRGVNMIVSACASLDYDVKDSIGASKYAGMRQKQLVKLINLFPNPYQSIQEFRTHIFTDFILEGNIFIYFDGVYLYHLPSKNVVVHSDPKTFVAYYEYDNEVKFRPDEIIHVKDVSGRTIYRGQSRLVAATNNLATLESMLTFQNDFFKNGAVPGLILGTDNTLSENSKDRTVARWMQKYSAKAGAKKPMIIDSGLKPFKLSEGSFKELDFDTSVKTHNVKILETLGVPPVLLDGGNQANISPNLRLFYLETVLPIVRKLGSSIEHMFGFDVEPIVSNVSALQPELKDIAAYHSTLVNTGIITANEARKELRYEAAKDATADDLRIPANIAGSAANPAVGGAPKKDPPEKN